MSFNNVIQVKPSWPSEFILLELMCLRRAFPKNNVANLHYKNVILDSIINSSQTTNVTQT